MAKFSRGMTFTVNDFLTAARLHALIDTAVAGTDGYPGLPQLYDVDSPSCAAGVRLIATSTPGSPVTGDLLVGSDGLLDWYDGATFTNTEPNYIALQNNSGLSLVTGTPVVMDVTSPSAFVIHGQAGNAPDPFGVTLEAVNPLATCNVAFRGVVPMRINNLAINSGGMVVIFGGNVYSAGQAQFGRVPAAAQTGQSDALGISLEPGNFGYGTQRVLLLK